MEQLRDLETFLKSVDTISELVKELKSCDADTQRKAVEKADRYISALEDGGGGCSTKVNRTMINTNTNTNAAPPATAAASSTSPEQMRHQMRSPQNDACMSSDNFMKMMEKDADDRMRRRRAKEKRANDLKDKGNEAYKRHDYESAVRYYSDGLAELKDMQPLYTNRAQAYIKLGRYTEAVSDCEWALKCNERCIKAYVHMGKAYLGMHKYKESRNSYGKIAEIEPGKAEMVKEYLSEVERQAERESQERRATEELDKGEGKATAVPLLLEKLSRPGQSPLYCRGALELLSQAITDSASGQSLFRLNNGFSVISGNDTVRSCLLQGSRDPELCTSLLRLWRVICKGNDENQKMLMTRPDSSRSIVDLLASEHAAVRLECLALLCLCSETAHGRRLAVDTLNLHMLVKNLMLCISKPKDKQQHRALTVLENFASENKFCVQLQDKFAESVLVPFITTLRTVSSSNPIALPALIVAVGCLARDDVIRRNMADCSECWEALLVAMEQCSEGEIRGSVYPLLGLIFNLSTVTSPAIQAHAVSLCKLCLALLSDSEGGIITRATGVLSAVLPQSPAAVQLAVQEGVVAALRRLLKGAGPKTTKFAMKTLAVCTAASHAARTQLLASDKRLSVLLRLLGSGYDEVVSGNAALCLSHCLDVEGTALRLLGTDVVPLLLQRATGDAGRADARQGAAIALGKLCQAEPRHRKKLRELRGFEILHSIKM